MEKLQKVDICQDCLTHKTTSAYKHTWTTSYRFARSQLYVCMYTCFSVLLLFQLIFFFCALFQDDIIQSASLHLTSKSWRPYLDNCRWITVTYHDISSFQNSCAARWHLACPWLQSDCLTTRRATPLQSHLYVSGRARTETAAAPNAKTNLHAFGIRFSGMRDRWCRKRYVARN